AGGVVYVGDEEGWLHAVEAASGRARWTFETGGEIYASVLPLGERLIFGSYDGFLYALRAADGSVAWKYETPDRIHATPGFSRGRLLVAGCDATLHMIDAASGEALAEAGIGAPCGAAPAA